MAKKRIEDKIMDSVTDTLTYNPLMNALRANDKKNLFKPKVTTFFHKTGFPLYDYYFGSVINIHNELGAVDSQEPMVGQANGSFNVIIGKSATGKSTLAIQLAANIIRSFKSGTVQHYDCENRLQQTRVEVLTGLPARDFADGGRYQIYSGSVSLAEMQEAIIKTYVEKMKMKDSLIINTGRKNELGEYISVLEPTVIIIDSIANVLSESFSYNNTAEVDKAIALQGNTEGARNAKTLRGFLKDINPLCKEANIIVFAINHITSNMSMNSFTGPKKKHHYLDQDEAIPGGDILFFNAFNFLKLISRTSEEFTEEKDGFAGHIISCNPIKSSSNQSGNSRSGVSFELVFAHKTGFDSLRSLIWYAKNIGIIEGNKPAYRFKGDPSFSFSWKNIHKEKDEKPIWDCVKKFIIPELEKQLSFVDPSEQIFDERSMDY